jgi:hypothetical protein
MEGQTHHDTCADTVGTDCLRREHQEAAILELRVDVAAKVLEHDQNNQGQLKLTRCCDFRE